MRMLLAGFVCMSGIASAQCRLGAMKPAEGGEALREQMVEDVYWGYLSPVLKGEESYTLIDPLHPKRRAKVDNNARLGVVTASRGIAISAYQQGNLFSGALDGRTPLKSLLEPLLLMPLLDAADGAGGETWVVLGERPERALPA